jgi:hypothetical protein
MLQGYISYQYDETRPPRPDASVGRVFAQNTHGHVAYLAQSGDALLTKLEVAAFGLFALFGRDLLFHSWRTV